MKQLTGKAISAGTAIGTIEYIESNTPSVLKMCDCDISQEFSRYEWAKKQAGLVLKELQAKAVAEMGSQESKIIAAQLIILDDEDFNESVLNLIKLNRVNAEYAIKLTGESFARLFEKTADEVISSRKDDVLYITNMLINILSGHTKNETVNNEKHIIASSVITPADIIKIGRDNIAGIIVEKCTKNAHIGILARSLRIPMLSVDSLLDVNFDVTVILDATNEVAIIDPDDDLIRKYSNQLSIDAFDYDSSLPECVNSKKSYRHVEILANVGGIEEISTELIEKADGVGLFRTEFMCLSSNRIPNEDEQHDIYRTVAQKMKGKRVVIRTFDIGDDKKIDDTRMIHLSGARGIRMLLEHADILEAQLKAILRASAYGNIAIMYPMVTGPDEIIRAKEIVARIMREFDEARIEYNHNIEQGIMIETPAAVLLSEELARECDFFSIGTNDLTQYTLAIDRFDPELEIYYQPGHDAILKMMEIVVKNAHSEGIKVTVCGELNQEIPLLQKMLDIGVDGVSGSIDCVVAVRNMIYR